MIEVDTKQCFGEDFGLKSIKVPKVSKKNTYIPSIDNSYVFDRDKLQAVLYYLNKSYGDALFLQGPAGVGKTTLINQVAARLNWPVEEVTLCNRSVITDLVGTPVVYENNMQYVYGPLTLAMLYGHILILNEIDTVSAGDLTFLNDVIEGRVLKAPDNPNLFVRPHPLFRVVFTANTKGNGDDNGFYTGTKIFNQAFIDRMRFVTFDYNSKETESKILLMHTKLLTDKTISLLMDFVREVRFNTVGSNTSNEQLTSPLTTRTLVKIARYISDYPKVSVQEAILKFYALRFSVFECEYIMRLCSDVFGNSPYYNAMQDTELLPCDNDENSARLKLDLDEAVKDDNQDDRSFDDVKEKKELKPLKRARRKTSSKRVS